MALVLTRERVADLIVVARTTGHAGHVFGRESLGILWSHPLQQCLLTFRRQDGAVDQIWLPATRAEEQIWIAINERLPWLGQAQEVV
ncbi:MAG TPA: hypothetical protein PKK15_11970 [Kouleothrix sp.]|nr:hypothetical protein [Kouleothrix sp.]